MVVKNALIIDMLRDIRKSLGRFLSIAAIISLGVAFYSGLKISPEDMKYTADNYYDDYNLMDIRIVSALGLTEEDLKQIIKVDGIKDAYGTYTIDVLAEYKETEIVLRAHGLPTENGINQINLVEGRLPQNPNEAVIEKGKNDFINIPVGSTIELFSGKDYPLDSQLDNTKYQIVGKVQTPYYLSFEKGYSNIGNGQVKSFIMIPQENFKLEVYTDIYATVVGAIEENSYSDEYFQIIEKVTDRLEKIKQPIWRILDRNSHYSYVDYGGAADRIDALSRVFPIFFALVAALVCLTTMTRMVDEQRVNIGTFKALGYSKGAIASKFVFYALAATIIGSIVGVGIGYTLFPTVIFNAYGIMYLLPPVILKFNLELALLIFLVAVSLTTLTAYMASSNELREGPASLMRPRAPKMGKRIFLERIPFIWNRFNFSYKVTTRNIFRYKRRFLMTVFGIAGCTALMLAGFGIRDSIRTVVDKQHGTLFNYDVTVGLDEENARLLDENEIIQDYEFILRESGSIRANEIEKNIGIVVVRDIENINKFISFQNRKTQERIRLSDEGVVITEQVSKILDVDIGHEIILKNNDDKEVLVMITGITENYTNNYVYLSPSYYTEIFNKEPKFNEAIGIILNSSKELEDKLSRELISKEGINNVSFNSTIRNEFNNTINSLNYVVLVMIISAGALAFVVLYNLTNVNISERIREIATIKVLGFYDNEVSAYIYRENTILTIMGTIVGIVMGIFLHRYIMTTVEMDNIMFGLDLNWKSYIISVVLTLIFAVLVNLAMYYKLKNVEMVESLKSID